MQILLSQVVRIHGNPNKVRDEVLKIIDAPEARREIDYLIEMVHAFSYYDVPASISVDLGLVRGIAYYTGVTFEIQYLGSDGWSSIGGGGRYDGLVQALGGVRNTPAMGFAWPMDRSISPLPISRSAPSCPRTTRESVGDNVLNAIRVGMFALMRPVTTSTDGL